MFIYEAQAYNGSQWFWLSRHTERIKATEHAENWQRIFDMQTQVVERVNGVQLSLYNVGTNEVIDTLWIDGKHYKDIAQQVHYWLAVEVTPHWTPNTLRLKWDADTTEIDCAVYGVACAYRMD